MRVVIESMEGYEAACKAFSGQDVVWYTTSPAILVRLEAQGKDVRSMERGVPRKVFNALSHACYDAADGIAAMLNEQCAWRGYADLGAVLSSGMVANLFVPLYKGMLLGNVLEEAGGEDVVCVGDASTMNPVGPTLGYQRLDTLYSVLAERAGAPFVHLPLDRDEARADSLERSIRYPHRTGIERVMSLLCNTWSSFFFKIFKTLKNKGLSRNASFRLRPKRTFYVYKECELIDEAVLGLLARGGRVAMLDDLPAWNGEAWDAGREVPGASVIEDRFKVIVEEALRTHGVDTLPLAGHCIALACERSRLVLRRLYAAFDALTDEFDTLVRGLAQDAEIITNSLNAPIQRLFSCYCREKGVPITAFDHGITMGLSEWSHTFSAIFGLGQAPRGIYHNHEGAACIARHYPDQEQAVVGVPKTTARMLFPSLQRFLARKWLGVGRGEHVIVFLASLDRNNSIFGPDHETDLDYLHSTRECMRYLAAEHPDSRCILKLYPSQRYADHHDFRELEAEFPNVMIIKDMDFRYIRAAADEIYLVSSQSTLGWALGAGVPCYFVRLACTPVSFKGDRVPFLQDDLIEGAERMDAGHEVMEPRNLKPLFRCLTGGQQGGSR